MSERLLNRVLGRLLRPVIIRLERMDEQAERRDAVGERSREALMRLEARLTAVERDLAKLTRVSTEMHRAAASRVLMSETRRIGRDVRALLRRQLIDTGALPYPHRLTAGRANVASQNEGDGILLALLALAGTPTGRFVDIGSGISGGATAVLARELGWSGLMVDGNAEHVAIAQHRFDASRVRVVHSFVTAENINPLLAKHGCEGDVDVLALDIDGNDYWIWKAIEVCRPRIAVIEYNPFLGLGRAVSVPYAADFRRQALSGLLRKHYLGASLPAFVKLGREKGYRLVATDLPGLNAFFVRDDVAAGVPECPLRALPYREPDTGKYPDLYDTAAAAGLPFVDV